MVFDYFRTSITEVVLIPLLFDQVKGTLDGEQARRWIHR